jgi:hypothetical protein
MKTLVISTALDKIEQLNNSVEGSQQKCYKSREDLSRI